MSFLSLFAGDGDHIAPVAKLFSAIDQTMARVEFDAQGTIVTANEHFLHCTGYTLDEILGGSHAMFVDEATRGSSGYRDLWDRLRAGRFQAGEFRRVGKGGRPIWLQATYSPIKGRDGHVCGVVKLAVDITEQVRLREADRAIQQRFTEMVENTTVRLILADTDLRIVYMNPASIECFEGCSICCRVPSMRLSVNRSISSIKSLSINGESSRILATSPIVPRSPSATRCST